MHFTLLRYKHQPEKKTSINVKALTASMSPFDRRTDLQTYITRQTGRVLFTYSLLDFSPPIIFNMSTAKINLLQPCMEYVNGLPKFVMHKSFHTMCSKTKVYKFLVSPHREILVESIIKTFIKIIKIKQNDRSSHVHTHLNSVHIVANLKFEFSACFKSNHH